MKLTVIIPTYNRCDLLGECLESLHQQEYRNVQVLVVDDGSEEDVQGFVADRFPDSKVLRQDENAGFAATVNAGLRAADTEYLMLLNNDMTLEPDCIGKLMEAVETGPAAMVAPLVLWKDDPEMVYSAGDQFL